MSRVIIFFRRILAILIKNNHKLTENDIGKIWVQNQVMLVSLQLRWISCQKS